MIPSAAKAAAAAGATAEVGSTYTPPLPRISSIRQSESSSTVRTMPFDSRTSAQHCLAARGLGHGNPFRRGILLDDARNFVQSGVPGAQDRIAPLGLNRDQPGHARHHAARDHVLKPE